jgi:hypothetical protein
MYRPRLETEQVTGYYEADQHILFVTYRGVLTPDVTAQVYRWLGELIQNGPDPLDRVRGSIYDFRQVTTFDNRNLTSAQRQSQHLNHKVDVSNIPVALIAGSLYQEEILRVTMKITAQPAHDERRRIVKSDAEALAFIDQFNKVHRLLEG